MRGCVSGACGGGGRQTEGASEENEKEGGEMACYGSARLDLSCVRVIEHFMMFEVYRYHSLTHSLTHLKLPIFNQET